MDVLVVVCFFGALPQPLHYEALNGINQEIILFNNVNYFSLTHNEGCYMQGFFAYQKYYHIIKHFSLIFAMIPILPNV